MARLNVEACWWTDPRRLFLIKRGLDADGIAIRAWALAQEFWKQGRRLVPKALFDSLDGAQALLEAGLADAREAFVYVRGSSAYLDWVAEQREIARAAGKKSAEARRAKTGSAQPQKPLTPKNPERLSNDSRTESNVVEPSVSVSGSLSVSGSNSEKSRKTEIQKTEEASEGKGSPVQEFIRVYCEEFKFRYGTNPPIGGKGSGIAKRIVKDLGVARASRLAVAYLAMNDTWFIQRRHDLATLEGSLNAVAIFADTGASVTQGELRQADRAQTNQNVWDALKTNPGASHGK